MGRYFVEYRASGAAALTVAAPNVESPTTADVVAPQPAASRSVRSLAVDALRGVAIFLMVESQTKPYGVLPAWMYHAQEPPPTHEPNLHLPGLTFSDVGFPFFLLTIGVAIPLAVSARTRHGADRASIVRGALTRGLLLLFLAFFRQQFAVVPSPVQPEHLGWMVALAAFPVMFAIFTRLPQGWNRAVRVAVRLAGWAGAIALFVLVPLPDGTRFNTDRYDVILVTSAACVVGGTVVWLCTQGRIAVRLTVMGAIAYLSPPYVEYLLITLPGTIVGDAILRRLHPDGPVSIAPARHWSRGRTWALAFALALFVPLLLVGVQLRYVAETTVVASLLCAAAFALARRPGTTPEFIVRDLVAWGSLWLLLGLVFDPIEGGTQKLPTTFAWMFQSVGLGVLLIATFTIVIDILSKRWLQLLVDNGQNPMLAYVCYATLILPLIGLSGVKSAVESIDSSRWVLFGWGVVWTLTVALTVRACTRARIFWRT